MNKLFLALVLSLVGHIMAWFHMQAQFVLHFIIALVGTMSILRDIGMLDLLVLVWQQ